MLSVLNQEQTGRNLEIRWSKSNMYQQFKQLEGADIISMAPSNTTSNVSWKAKYNYQDHMHKKPLSHHACHGQLHWIHYAELQ